VIAGQVIVVPHLLPDSAGMPTSLSATAAHRVLPLGGRGLLRAALQLDAAVTGLSGAGYLAGATLLEGPLGLSAGGLRGVGGLLLAYATGIGWAGTRRQVPRAAGWVAVWLNSAWAAGSVALAVAGWGSPTTLGTSWIAIQALVVAGFAAAQRAGLRQRVATTASTARWNPART